MFLSRMVSGLICSKNHNKNNQANQPATKSPKPNKKNEKCKRSLSKTNSKLSISDLLKSNVKENQSKETTTTISSISNNKNNQNIHNNHNNHHNHNIGGSSSSSSSSGGHNGNVTNNNNIKLSTNKPPTKVKSGSWKRSEKQISSYNTISGKKSKSLRKRSPTWLKFPNSPVKIAEKVSYVGTNDTTSVCRPGTLYSDVLFGAGSSCLVKIKTLTPRRNTNNAQKKLTKALIKSCKSNENESVASGSDTETDRELFPSLNDFNKSPNTTTPSNINAENLKTLVTKSDDDDDIAGVGGGGGSHTTDDGADVVILSETSGIQNSENGFNDVSYGSYLEHHFSQVNGDRTTATTATDIPQTSGKPFTIDIPQWNFMDADISSEAYPKFLCQFEDEHYLKAEKMALLGLKLALGNNTNQGKFKF